MITDALLQWGTDSSNPCGECSVWPARGTRWNCSVVHLCSTSYTARLIKFMWCFLRIVLGIGPSLASSWWTEGQSDLWLSSCFSPSWTVCAGNECHPCFGTSHAPDWTRSTACALAAIREGRCALIEWLICSCARQEQEGWPWTAVVSTNTCGNGFHNAALLFSNDTWLTVTCSMLPSMQHSYTHSTLLFSIALAQLRYLGCLSDHPWVGAECRPTPSDYTRGLYFSFRPPVWNCYK